MRERRLQWSGSGWSDREILLQVGKGTATGLMGLVFRIIPISGERWADIRRRSRGRCKGNAVPSAGVFFTKISGRGKTMSDDDETKTLSTIEKVIGLALASPIFLALALMVGLIAG